MEAEDGVVPVIFPGQKGGQRLPVQLGGKSLEALLHLREEALVLHLLGHLDGGDHILVHGTQGFVVSGLVLELLGALKHLLALRGVVPEVRLGGLFLQLGDLGLGLVQIQRLLEIIQLGLEVIQLKTNIVVNKHSISLHRAVYQIFPRPARQKHGEKRRKGPKGGPFFRKKRREDQRLKPWSTVPCSSML